MYNVLEKNEKKIIDYILEKEGQTTQADIYKKTGIPKSSLSDLIKRLDKRNIIKTSKKGRTKKIKLKSWVLK